MNSKILSVKRRNTIEQFVRYGLVGILNNLLGYSGFLILTWMGFQPKLVMTIFYFTSTILNFFGMRQWVFTNKQSVSMYNTALRFFIVYFIGYLINLTILVEFSDKLGYSYQLVQAGAIAVIVVYFFITLKLFVFPSPKLVEE